MARRSAADMSAGSGWLNVPPVTASCARSACSWERDPPVSFESLLWVFGSLIDRTRLMPFISPLSRGLAAGARGGCRRRRPLQAALRFSGQRAGLPRGWRQTERAGDALGRWVSWEISEDLYAESTRLGSLPAAKRRAPGSDSRSTRSEA